MAAASRGAALELQTNQLRPLPTVKPFAPIEFVNFVPANTMLPLVVLMPCPLMSVRSAVLAIVT